MAEHKQQSCKIHGETKHRINTKNSGSICLKCDNEKRQKRTNTRRKKLVEKFGAKCIHCGYNSCYSALEFHHVDPTLKSFSLSGKIIVSKSWETVFEEAQKCALLCSNCHREVHANILKITGTIGSFKVLKN